MTPVVTRCLFGGLLLVVWCRRQTGSWTWCQVYSTVGTRRLWLTWLTVRCGSCVRLMNIHLTNTTLCLMTCGCYGSI